MPSNSSVPAPSSKNATAVAAAAAAAAAKKAVLATIAKEQMLDQQAACYFAMAMAGLIILFTTFHWSRFLYSRYASKRVRESKVMRAQVAIARLVRNVLINRVPGFTSMGHLILVAAYLAINITLTVTNIEWSSLLGIAKRFGWMAISNVAFITFLALKNTPLAYLTAYSYERLNPLHQVAGYTTVTLALLHSITVSVSFIRLHNKSYLLEAPQLHAMAAVSAFFVLLVFAILVKRIRYEVFYISHILMYMVIIINIGFHRPLLSTRSVIITGFAGGLWGLDRLLRAGRILWYAYDNSATITPLPHGGTRIMLRRSPSGAVAGSHCFLWIPKIRAFETHPFTIIRATSLSLDMVVAAHDGFTNDLHNYAVKHPGVILRASIDGPYGQLPNFSKVADKVILVAGGSGATFTFGVALDMIKKLGDSAKPTIEFIWTVKEEESLSWFSKELMELQASPRVTIALHSTRPSCTQSPSSPISPLDEKPSALQLENASPISKSSTQPGDLLSRAFSADPEKNTSPSPQCGTPWDSSTSLEILYRRPDVETLIKDVVAKAGKDERVLIAACGPEGLMWSVRRTAAGCITVGGASVELHCEQFGW